MRGEAGQQLRLLLLRELARCHGRVELLRGRVGDRRLEPLDRLALGLRDVRKRLARTQLRGQLCRLQAEIGRDVVGACHQAGAEPEPETEGGRSAGAAEAGTAEVAARAAEAGAAEDRLRAVLDALLDRVGLLLGQLAGRHLRVDLIGERLLECIAELGRVDPERAGGVVDDGLAARLRGIVLGRGVRRSAADDRDDGERAEDHSELAVGGTSLGGHPALPSRHGRYKFSQPAPSESTRTQFLGPRCEQHRSAIRAESLLRATRVRARGRRQRPGNVFAAPFVCKKERMTATYTRSRDTPAAPAARNRWRCALHRAHHAARACDAAPLRAGRHAARAARAPPRRAHVPPGSRPLRSAEPDRGARARCLQPGRPAERARGRRSHRAPARSRRPPPRHHRALPEGERMLLAVDRALEAGRRRDPGATERRGARDAERVSRPRGRAGPLECDKEAAEECDPAACC